MFSVIMRSGAIFVDRSWIRNDLLVIFFLCSTIQPSSTLQKLEVCARYNDIAKPFKICYSCIWNTKTYDFMLLYFQRISYIFDKYQALYFLDINKQSLLLSKNSKFWRQYRLNEAYYSYRYKILWKPSLSHKDKLEPEIIKIDFFFRFSL